MWEISLFSVLRFLGTTTSTISGGDKFPFVFFVLLVFVFFTFPEFFLREAVAGCLAAFFEFFFARAILICEFLKCMHVEIPKPRWNFGFDNLN